MRREGLHTQAFSILTVPTQTSVSSGSWGLSLGSDGEEGESKQGSILLPYHLSPYWASPQSGPGPCPALPCLAPALLPSALLYGLYTHPDLEPACPWWTHNNLGTWGAVLE